MLYIYIMRKIEGYCPGRRPRSGGAYCKSNLQESHKNIPSRGEARAHIVSTGSTIGETVVCGVLLWKTLKPKG